MKRKDLVKELVNLARRVGLLEETRADLLILAANAVSKEGIVKHLSAQDWRTFKEGKNPFLNSCADKKKAKLREIVNFFEEVLGGGEYTFSIEFAEKAFKAAGKFDEERRKNWKSFSAGMLKELREEGSVDAEYSAGLFRMYLILKGNL